MCANKYVEYSVLMSVYHKEKPVQLEQAIESIQMQTLPASDFVLVCDGPLSSDLDDVIKREKEKMGKILNIVRLPQNVGLGRALNEGIKHCRCELVARMDSDDISYPDRCEKQVMIFSSHPEVSVCSGIVEEFSSDVHVVDSRRVPPETQALLWRRWGPIRIFICWKTITFGLECLWRDIKATIFRNHFSICELVRICTNGERVGNMPSLKQSCLGSWKTKALLEFINIFAAA